MYEPYTFIFTAQYYVWNGIGYNPWSNIYSLHIRNFRFLSQISFSMIIYTSVPIHYSYIYIILSDTCLYVGRNKVLSTFMYFLHCAKILQLFGC